jgi:hypothetical protein
MISNRLFVVGAVFMLASCGSGESAPDPAGQASRGIMGQAALFCPTENFSWETFDAAATAIGAEPDGGEVHKAPTVTASEVVRERWVALTQSGRRTTVWIAELGPGVRYLDGALPIEHASGLVCMIHDPGLTRDEAAGFAQQWEGVEMTGAKKIGPGDLDLEARQWTVVLTGSGARDYMDLQMYTPDPEYGEGAMLTRHFYVRARPDATTP